MHVTLRRPLGSLHRGADLAVLDRYPTPAALRGRMLLAAATLRMRGERTRAAVSGV